MRSGMHENRPLSDGTFKCLSWWPHRKQRFVACHLPDKSAELVRPVLWCVQCSCARSSTSGTTAPHTYAR